MNTFARRALTTTLAAAALIPALSPTASAMDISSQITGVQEQVSTQVAGVQSQINSQIEDTQSQAHDTLLSHIGEGMSVTYGYTTISSQQAEVTAPVATDQQIVDTVNHVINDYGVNVSTGYETASITPVAPETTRVYDASLEPGTEQVVDEGRDGINWNVGQVGGQVAPADNAVVAFGPEKPKPAPVPAPVAVSAGNYGVWSQLAQCESGGNWAINTGNGYYGGLQFHPQTWTGHGGGQYAAYAHQATPEQQIEIAQRVQASQGWGAWPACTAKLGIR